MTLRSLLIICMLFFLRCILIGLCSLVPSLGSLFQSQCVILRIVYLQEFVQQCNWYMYKTRGLSGKEKQENYSVTTHIKMNYNNLSRVVRCICCLIERCKLLSSYKLLSLFHFLKFSLICFVCYFLCILVFTCCVCCCFLYVHGYCIINVLCTVLCWISLMWIYYLFV